MNKKIAITFAIAAVSIVSLGSVLAAEQSNFSLKRNGGQHMQINKPMYGGKVTAVSGNMITIQSYDNKDKKEVTYTVDASNAKISKGFGPNAQVITIAHIVVGQSVGVEGTLTGTNIVATSIVYGMPERGRGMENQGPHYGGKVTAVSGNMITIQSYDNKDKKEVTYTVNASGAKISKGFGPNAQVITIADIVVGQSIGVEGTLTGTNIVATSIVYGMPRGEGCRQGQDK